MYAGAESPHHQRRLAPGRGDLATPPGMDHRNGKTKTESVNQFQTVFLSELVLHYTKQEGTLMYSKGQPDWLNADIVPVDPWTQFEVWAKLREKTPGNIPN